MKMQDVIGKLREEAPLLEKCAKDVDTVFNRAWGLFDDFRRAESEAGRMLLADAMRILFKYCWITNADWEAAHYWEAQRELPQWDEWSSDYHLMIYKIRDEFMVNHEEAPGSSTDAGTKGGE